MSPDQQLIAWNGRTAPNPTSNRTLHFDTIADYDRWKATAWRN